MSFRIQCVCIGSAVSWVVLPDPDGNELCVFEPLARQTHSVEAQVSLQ
jgi:hypothetical protein